MTLDGADFPLLSLQLLDVALCALLPIVNVRQACLLLLLHAISPKLYKSHLSAIPSIGT